MGASGGIGQPMSLLLKDSPLVTELALYDIVNTPGVAADLSHINTATKVKAFNGPEQLKDSLKGAQVYVSKINLFAVSLFYFTIRMNPVNTNQSDQFRLSILINPVYPNDSEKFGFI